MCFSLNYRLAFASPKQKDGWKKKMRRGRTQPARIIRNVLQCRRWVHILSGKKWMSSHSFSQRNWPLEWTTSTWYIYVLTRVCCRVKNVRSEKCLTWKSNYGKQISCSGEWYRKRISISDNRRRKWIFHRVWVDVVRRIRCSIGREESPFESGNNILEWAQVSENRRIFNRPGSRCSWGWFIVETAPAGNL